MTNAVNLASVAGNGFYARNRIINGAMEIDQRNAGASVTPTGPVTYLVDRFALIASAASKLSAQQNAGSVTPPAGFTKYLGFISLSSYSIGAADYFTIQQPIEGFNIADLAWGTANAKTIILSFWVYSSLTGTFGGAVYNDSANRSYPFSYSISSANTWEYKTITIPGDTTGTWVTNNGVGVRVNWGLGVGATDSGTAGAWTGSLKRSATGTVSVVGTNGATFYLTGVQFEVGTQATPFERRLYPQELAMCQRYYEKSYTQNSAPGTNVGLGQGIVVASDPNPALNYIAGIVYKVEKRAVPTLVFYNTAGTAGFLTSVQDSGITYTVSSAATTTYGIREISLTTKPDRMVQVLYTSSAEL